MRATGWAARLTFESRGLHWQKKNVHGRMGSGEMNGLLAFCICICSDGVKVTASGLTRQQQQRVAAHSHIRSLGLAADGTALPQGGGMVGQQEAREAAGIIVDLIKSRKLAGQQLFSFVSFR